MSARSPSLLGVIRRRREGAPIDVVPPPRTANRPPAKPGTYRWPEPGSIEQLFREAQRLR